LSYRPYLFLVGFVALLLLLPGSFVSSVRSGMIRCVIPSWQSVQWVKCGIDTLCSSEEKEEHSQEGVRESLLALQLDRIQNWLLNEKRLSEQCSLFSALTGESEDSFFERRQTYLAQIIAKGLTSLPAKVVFRQPATWSSCIWLNVGERANRQLQSVIVAKNSPVVLGKNIVGVVEEVLETKCRVRLLTDRALTPSVRVVRGGEQDRVLFETLNTLIQMIAGRADLQGAEELAQVLAAFQGQLSCDPSSLYLAKGEIHGSGAPLWRGVGHRLKGEGFNYDFSDEEGEARELRTGGCRSKGATPLIKTGDLLVTTGMDGIFPPDFHVGIVSKIFPLHEGGSSYELEATPTVSNLDHLTEVFVLPPY